MNLPLRKGTGGPNKTEEESKQFMLQIFDLENFKEKLQHNFPKMRGGGGQRPFGTLPKFIHFGVATRLKYSGGCMTGVLCNDAED